MGSAQQAACVKGEGVAKSDVSVRWHQESSHDPHSTVETLSCALCTCLHFPLLTFNFYPVVSVLFPGHRSPTSHLLMGLRSGSSASTQLALPQHHPFPNMRDSSGANTDTILSEIFYPPQQCSSSSERSHNLITLKLRGLAPLYYEIYFCNLLGLKLKVV